MRLKQGKADCTHHTPHASWRKSQCQMQRCKLESQIQADQVMRRSPRKCWQWGNCHMTRASRLPLRSLTWYKHLLPGSSDSQEGHYTAKVSRQDSEHLNILAVPGTSFGGQPGVVDDPTPEGPGAEIILGAEDPERLRGPYMLNKRLISFTEGLSGRTELRSTGHEKTLGSIAVLLGIVLRRVSLALLDVLLCEDRRLRRFVDHRITQFFGSPQGPLSSSFSGVCAGCVVFVAPALVPAPVAAVVAFGPSPAGVPPFSFVAAAAAGFVLWSLPSSHAKLTLLTCL